MLPPRRGGAPLLPYGVAPDGRLVRASAVPAGLACGCACPACGAPLVARRGAVLAAHFAHAASDRACAGALETVLHRLAKQLIADGAPLDLPEVAAEHAGRRRLVRPAATVRAESAALEPGLDGLRPDVVAVVAGRPLLVEVAVTHVCGPEKVALIRERRLAAVEIDLSGLARDAPPEALERAVLRSAPRRWLWNRHAEAAEAAMRAEAERLAARRARGREEALARVARELAAAAAARPCGTRRRRLAGPWRRCARPGSAARSGPRWPGTGASRWRARSGRRGSCSATCWAASRSTPRPRRRSLRPVLRRGFAEPRPGGFGWPELAARCPALRPPSEVVADYARALGVMGLLARGADGLWRSAGAAAAARGRRDALAAQRKRLEGQAALPRRAGWRQRARADPREEELPRSEAERIPPPRLAQPAPEQPH